MQFRIGTPINLYPMAGHHRIPPTSVADSAKVYWDLNLTFFEWILLGIQAVLCSALHTTPILNSSLAAPLTILMALAGLWSPVSGFFFIAATQYLPFPQGFALQGTEIGPIALTLTVLLRRKRLLLTGVGNLKWLVPWLMWSSLVSMNWSNWLPNSNLMKAVFYAIMACQLANESKGRYVKCLFGLCLGAIFVSVAYWGNHLGLPIELNDIDGERQGIPRLGGVRADAVMVWPPLLIGFGGLSGLLIAYASKWAKAEMPKSIQRLVMVLMLLTIPPLFATMTHGAYAGLAIMILAIVGAMVYVSHRKEFIECNRVSLIRALGIFACIAAICFSLDLFQMRSQTMALGTHYNAVTEQTGWEASRSDVWGTAVRTILKYPFFGLPPGDVEEIPLEYRETTGYYMSHNVFLDVGRGSGIPGIICFSLFFFAPVHRMLRRRHFTVYVPFLLAYFAVFVFLMSVSSLCYKTFWALWILMAVACPAHRRVV